MVEHGRVTSLDVATAAGVSRATVSYVLNDTPGQKIPPSTRERVRQAADRLGYTPSSAARTLRRGHSDLVLYLLPDLPIGSTLGATIEHLSAGLATHGLTLVVHPGSRNSLSMVELARAIRPAAVITFNRVDDETRARLRTSGNPTLITLLDDDPTASPDLVLSQQNAGRLQVQHLAAGGHRHLGYAWPDDPRVRGFAAPRLAGAQTAAADLGLDPPSVLEVPLDADHAATAIRTWRHADPAITGICAYNDETAMALIAGAARLGLRIPADLAIIGVDDIPAAALTVPALTTVGSDPLLLAGYLTAIVIARITAQPTPNRPTPTGVRLIVRQST